MFAQMGVGEPYDFCTVTGIQYNPYGDDNMWVTSNEEFSHSEIESITTGFMDVHPEFIMLDSASATYNCHGYSCGIYQGTENVLICWRDTLFLDGSFVKITDTNEIKKGDIAIIRIYKDNNYTSFINHSPHSSIVYNKDTLISKLNDNPLFMHHKYAPYIVEITGLSTQAAVYEYYRRNVNTEINGNDEFYGNGTYTFVPNVTPSTCIWRVEPSGIFQTDTGTGYTTNLSYKSSFAYLAPSATLSFDFGYSCSNTYSTTKEIEVYIPTTIINNNINSSGFNIAQNSTVTVNGNIDFECDSQVIIPSTSTLILNGATLTAKQGRCKIIVDGALNLTNNVEFKAEDGAELEIIINTDNYDFRNVTFNNCILTLKNNNISFYNCDFIDTPIDFELSSQRTSSSITVSNCAFEVDNNTMNYAINIRNIQSYDINNCIINGNANNGYIRNGIQVYYCGNSASTSIKKIIKNNTIQNCIGTGLLMYASGGNVNMNEISNNDIGVKLLNNCNISSFNGICYATNGSATQYIHENDSYEIYMSSACNPQIFRYNIIEDNDSIPYIFYDGLVGFGTITPPAVRAHKVDVTYNNWGSNFNADQHLVSNVEVTFLNSPIWNLGNCIIPDPDTSIIVLDSAILLTSNGEYTEAKNLYMQIVEDYPTTTSAETALKTMLPLEYYVENDYEGLQQYYLEEEEIINDSVLLPLAMSLANKCNEEMGNYTDAINWYEGVITNPESTYNDSIFATIDLGNLYLKMEDNGAKGIRGKMTEYIPKTSKAYQEQRDYALTLLPKDRSTQEETSLANMVKEGAEYNTFIYNYFGYIEPIKTLTTKFEGYTTIGENEYMNVYQKDTSTTNEYELIGYMREEDNGKVYFYDNDKEYLLYDFGMKVGDSIKIYWQQCYECETYIRLDSITEEEIGGAMRKCYHTSSNEFGFWGAPVVWVEGIGSLDGLFYQESMTAPGGYITTLLCYKEKGELVYMNEEFDDCIIGNTLSEEEVMTGTSISKVYPNPGENILNIRTALPEGRIEVYDILGKVVYKQDITEEVTKIPTEGWAKGMYLWRVYSEGKEAESGKWVKQ